MEHTNPQSATSELPKEIEYCRTIWNNVHRTLPLGLFHYTDAVGLHGIVTSRRLWATHVYYLNDSQEFRYAGKLISSMFLNAIESCAGEIARRLSKLYDLVRYHFGFWESIADHYAVCFCAD